jgi:hypothetical protein
MTMPEETQDMGPHHPAHTLGELILSLQMLCRRNHGTKVSIGDIVHMLGERSFAPVILAVGLIAVTPIDSIPTLPTTFGIVVLLTAGQMLVGRRTMWLPAFIANRALASDRLGKALDWLRPYADRADGWLGSRIGWLTRGPFLVAIALCCALLAALMPMLELLPLVSTVPALAFVAFGIALLMHDGVATLAGFTFTLVTLALVAALVRLPF